MDNCLQVNDRAQCQIQMSVAKKPRQFSNQYGKESAIFRLNIEYDT